ncbi:MAG: glycosyltransferase family 39 protein [Alphaproteobacteria bacterium]|nr:glycosyltransferase family 39 protein [Alphaproteobacteria bacterium]MBU0873143.1 glycosyltransferase family 39 protein [Alphaproteobacteria bacterium]MBU1402488.1 glycosyltransferase family 39 protein [Alphaproteobacteria bacterium]MBU1593129.1 glycosyltransferase family 39 protein [Alphaproteobacteria bacterium]MBU1788998.1 glycosyltransferase family 39 protein [Alphaproteobacteria bacterium]
MLKNVLYPLVAALGVIGLVCLLGPWWSVYEFNSDEGLNLQKGLLVAQGYSLYSEIWSDQPPVLTYVLAAVQSLFPFSVTAARATILAFGALMAASLFRTVARFEGLAAGWIAVLLLACSSLYLELSVAVLIGLPAVALAMLSVDLATSATGNARAYRAAGAGVVFGLAVLTKMFALMIFPALLAGLWLAARNGAAHDRRDGITSTGWFLLAFVATGMAILLAIAGFAIDQLIGTHLAARSAPVFDRFGGFAKVIEILSEGSSVAFYFTVLFGIAAFCRRPGSMLLVPLLWLVAGLLVLGFHRPLWQHHLLILVPPLCWLGGVGFKSLFVPAERLGITNRVAEHRNRRVRLAGRLLILALAPGLTILAYHNLKDARRTLNKAPRFDEELARTTLALLGDQSGYLITDKPIDAFRFGKAVPPNLAVWSAKRVINGSIGEDEIVLEVKARPTSQVMLRRHAHGDGLLQRIAGHATRIPVATDRYSGVETDFFARDPEMRPLARQLLDQLPAVTAGSLGGVDGVNPGERLDRPQSTAPLPARSVIARPPGSAQELGSCLLAASRITRDPRLMLEAAGVGRALACVQTANGGWRHVAPSSRHCAARNFPATVEGGETLDDGTVPAALYFLFDLSDRFAELSIEPPAWLGRTIGRALDFSVNAQLENGAWPQSLVARPGYHEFATLNDDTTTGMMRVLIAAHARLGNDAYLDAARRGGEFLLRAQGGGGQQGFAQQYTASLEIAPARKFEPAAYSSLETGYAINALIDLYRATGDGRYLEAAQSAAGWLEASQTAPDEWARLYEIGSNKPIFADRKGNVTYDLSDLPVAEQTSYRWKGGRNVFPEIGLALDRLDRLDQGAESLRELDEEFAAASLLAATPTARLPLNPAAGTMTPETLGSTRKFAEYCAGLVARQAAKGSSTTTSGG